MHHQPDTVCSVFDRYFDHNICCQIRELPHELSLENQYSENPYHVAFYSHFDTVLCPTALSHTFVSLALLSCTSMINCQLKTAMRVWSGTPVRIASPRALSMSPLQPLPLCTISF